MRGLLILLLCLWPFVAGATQDDWPALFDVVGVASNDRLNIRETPGVGAPLIGTFAPGAIGIEVIQPNDAQTWGQVNLGERSGWVSLKYMRRQPGQWYGSVPAIRRCFGTEPFWQLSISRQQGSTFLTPEAELPVEVLSVLTSRNHRGHSAFLGKLGPDEMVLALRHGLCSDGMSDRAYGLEVDLISRRADGRGMLYTGCCSLAP